jgi:ribonuclease HI
MHWGTISAMSETAEFWSDEDLAEVIRRELQLLEPGCRMSSAAVLALLHPDFLEFGASGRRWDAASTAEMLALETTTVAPRTSDLVPVRLAGVVVLLTYTLHQPNRVSLRSSVWLRHPEQGWVLRFHQGTIAGSPTA